MHVLPVPVAAKRMAVLLVSVGVLDVIVSLTVPHPAVWCGCVGALMPLFTPLAILGIDRAPR